MNRERWASCFVVLNWWTNTHFCTECYKELAFTANADLIWCICAYTQLSTKTWQKCIFIVSEQNSKRLRNTANIIDIFIIDKFNIQKNFTYQINNFWGARQEIIKCKKRCFVSKKKMPIHEEILRLEAFHGINI